MNFELFDINSNRISIENVISYELLSEMDAVCDGLRIYFKYDDDLGEICTVKAYSNGNLIFNGFCDKERVCFDKSGKVYFIYARSSASLLVDNEAIPCQYSNPSARQLWLSNAKELGFSCALPEVYSENSYLVAKGTSCFGAINDFMLFLCGKRIYVTPQNEIKLYEDSDITKKLDDYNVLSFSHIINRSSPLSTIDYKINSADSYFYHIKSELADKMGIKRKRLYNYSSTPVWQREASAINKIISSLDDYYTVSVDIAGECDLKLNDRVNVSSVFSQAEGDYYVFEIVRSKGKNGEKTSAVLKKKLNGEIVNYVA